MVGGLLDAPDIRLSCFVQTQVVADIFYQLLLFEGLGKLQRLFRKRL